MTQQQDYKHPMQGLAESWEENAPGGNEGRAVAQQFTKAMIPSMNDPLAHLREMGRMPLHVQADMVILSSPYYRTSRFHQAVPTDAVDMFVLDEAARLVALTTQGSIGQNGLARGETKGVLEAIGKLAMRMSRRMRGGGTESTEMEGGL